MREETKDRLIAWLMFMGLLVSAGVLIWFLAWVSEQAVDQERREVLGRCRQDLRCREEFLRVESPK
jgi:hypothetical protein